MPLPHRPAEPKNGDLCADKVDVLPHAGACDPLPCLQSDIQEMVRSDAVMFASAPAGLPDFEDVDPDDRLEYVKLVVLQLRAQQLGLAEHALGGGKVLAVGKPGEKRQRVGWNGRKVSSAALRPPKPKHLARVMLVVGSTSFVYRKNFNVGWAGRA